MDQRLRRRITLFNLGGAVNVALGAYVAFEGPKFLPVETVRWLAFLFFVFAVVDFYFPYMLKRKWLEEQQRQALERQAAEKPVSSER